MAKKTTNDISKSNLNVEKENTVDNTFNSKKSEKARTKTIKVKALKNINFGKLELGGEFLFFQKGEVKEIEYRTPYAEVLDRASNDGFVEILDK